MDTMILLFAPLILWGWVDYDIISFYMDYGLLWTSQISMDFLGFWDTTIWSHCLRCVHILLLAWCGYFSYDSATGILCNPCHPVIYLFFRSLISDDLTSSSHLIVWWSHSRCRGDKPSFIALFDTLDHCAWCWAAYLYYTP